jgi:hypothetical protein
MLAAMFDVPLLAGAASTHSLVDRRLLTIGVLDRRAS